MSKGVTESVTKEVEEVHQAVKYSSVLSYMLKPTSLLTKVIKENNKAQKKSSSMCVILGNGQSKGNIEYPPVPILTLIPSNINTFCSIQTLWTALQVK